MGTLMNDDELTTLEQVRGFVDGMQPVTFEIRGKDACYAWIERTLLRFRYRRLGRAEKGLLVHCLMKVSGYPRQQITRLIRQYREEGRIRRRQRTINDFTRRYTSEDIRLLAETDRLRHLERAGHQEAHGARHGALRPAAVPTPCRDLGFPPLQPAPLQGLCSPASERTQDARQIGGHRRAP